MKAIEQDNKIRLQSLGVQTKRELKRKGQVEPEIQGYFEVDARTKIGIPKHLKGRELEKWKNKMIAKYTDYDKQNNIKRLSGMAKQLLKP
jgi:hypothetical protein